jgi:hypothetical protein
MRLGEVEERPSYQLMHCPFYSYVSAQSFRYWSCKVMTAKITKAENKAVYQAPKLKVFGSVRNLTGGSGGMSSDAGGLMTMML